ncbi:hypothetical protein K438DRAFT_1711567, partial [Mycena galopus ATCC 62051]
MSDQEHCWNCAAPRTCPPPLPMAPPELPALLHSNHVVDSVHAPYIHEFITTGRANLHSLKTRLKNLEKSIARLTHESRDLEQALRFHECALSPIRRLPSEIIGYIIRLSPDIRHEIGHSEHEHPPWRLAHVCARWRACALTDRCIW